MNKNEKLSVVFMGTPQFAVPCLQKLIDTENVTAVFTQPDKPKGRGYNIQKPPVKELAEKFNIPVYQPATLRNGEALEILKEINPDIIIVVAYGKILPKDILTLPKLGCINIHASLLPEYRGSAPIQWALLQGDMSTGVTSMYMDEGMDTGDMLIEVGISIDVNETFDELYTELSDLGANVLEQTLEALKNNTLKREKQLDSDATYAPMITKEMSLLDTKKSAWECHNQIRAITAYTEYNGKRLKIYKSDYQVSNLQEAKTFKIICADGLALSLKEVQLEGSKRMNIEQFLNGQGLLKSGILITGDNG
ncbi:MAG: methionyl-tRNA formyltransferase [Oscillospiraceae bacterium]|jgi:methionyl-tRNA formyltransferase|nr:methionyl-tRNA formyltransferase [Oscillospiraceae bacterium]